MIAAASASVAAVVNSARDDRSPAVDCVWHSAFSAGKLVRNKVTASQQVAERRGADAKRGTRIETCMITSTRETASRLREPGMDRTLGADNKTSRFRELAHVVRSPRAWVIISSVVPVQPAIGYAIDDDSQNANRQAIHYR